MRPDTLSVILRSASFIALFQTAGMAIFLAMFGRRLDTSRISLRRTIRISAMAAALLLVGQYSLEAARMADDLAAIADPSLQGLALHSASSVELAIRLSGLAMIAAAVGRGGDSGTAVTVVGAALVAASFWLTGHTVANPLRWALAPLLTFHVMIVAFWFGALVPLYITCAVETAAIAGKVTEAFSEVALWLVPGIALAGAALSIGLVHHTAELTTRYGLSLLAKFLGFVLLMGLAALNKWRLGPAIVVGDAFAIRSFRRCLAAEYVLISAVLSITAVMTTLYSPEP